MEQFTLLLESLGDVLLTRRSERSRFLGHKPLQRRLDTIGLWEGDGIRKGRLIGGFSLTRGHSARSNCCMAIKRGGRW